MLRDSGHARDQRRRLRRGTGRPAAHLVTGTHLAPRWSAPPAPHVCSVAEQVLDGETGRVVPRDDPEALFACLRSLLDDPELHRHMGQNGRRPKLEPFTVEHMPIGPTQLQDELLR